MGKECLDTRDIRRAVAVTACRLTDRWTGATAKELLSKRIRFYHGRLLAGGWPGQLQRWATLSIKRMTPKIEQLTEKEHAWIDAQLQGAAKLVESFLPETKGQPLSLKALDEAFALWLAGSPEDTQIINAVINRVGVAFGQFLVEGIGLSWVIATDEHGSDLAVHGLPGKGDVLVYPANFVAKRWERRETHFLGNSYQQIAEQVRSLEHRH